MGRAVQLRHPVSALRKRQKLIRSDQRFYGIQVNRSLVPSAPWRTKNATVTSEAQETGISTELDVGYRTNDSAARWYHPSAEMPNESRCR